MSQMIPEQGGMPPELMQLLAGGAGAGQAMAPEAPPQRSEEELFQEIIRMSEQLASLDGNLSESDRLSLDKIRMEVRKILAGREKEEQAALGGGPATNFLKRASGG